MKIKRNAVILCLIQVISVLGFYVVVKMISFLTKQPYIIKEPFLIYIFPPLIAAAASLALSIIIPINKDLQKALQLSIPATVVYFLFYILLPYIIGGFNAAIEALPTLCIGLIPLTIITLLVNGCAIYLGSLIHSIIFKTSENSD